MIQFVAFFILYLELAWPSQKGHKLNHQVIVLSVFFLFLVRGPFVLHGFLAPNHTNSTPLHRLAAAWGEVEESEDQWCLDLDTSESEPCASMARFLLFSFLKDVFFGRKKNPATKSWWLVWLEGNIVNLVAFLRTNQYFNSGMSLTLTLQHELWCLIWSQWRDQHDREPKRATWGNRDVRLHWRVSWRLPGWNRNSQNQGPEFK